MKIVFLLTLFLHHHHLREKRKDNKGEKKRNAGLSEKDKKIFFFCSL
jgi:hypothetical protein